MKKLLFAIVSVLFTISAFAAGYQYTAQCKMNSSSYVVASQEKGSTLIEVVGYGEAKNSTVVVYVQGHNQTYKYTVTIKDGYGNVEISQTVWYLIKVENIVCY